VAVAESGPVGGNVAGTEEELGSVVARSNLSSSAVFPNLGHNASAEEFGDHLTNIPHILDFATSLHSRRIDLDTLDISEEELAQKELDLEFFMNAHTFTVSENTSLTRVYRLYRAMGIRHLVVVNGSNEVAGMLTRRELHTDFSTDLA
jgi:CBS domain-containing protein